MPKKNQKRKKRGTKKDSAGGTTTPVGFQVAHSTYTPKNGVVRVFWRYRYKHNLEPAGIPFRSPKPDDRNLFFIAEIKVF